MATNTRFLNTDNLIIQEVQPTDITLQEALLLIRNNGKIQGEIEGGRKLYLNLTQLTELRGLLTTRWDEVVAWFTPPAKRRIVQARITAMPQQSGDPMPKVIVVFEGATEEVELFEFYPDEIMFTLAELVGLTEAEARALKVQKDRAYLTS